MSKARRIELEDISIRNNYLEKLAKAKHILPSVSSFVADEDAVDYSIPWL